MERRRVVHYVKSRTINGYTPPSKVRPVTPSSLSLSSDDGSSSVAPLATIDPDFSVDSKGRNGQNPKWRLIRRPNTGTETSGPTFNSSVPPRRCSTPNQTRSQSLQHDYIHSRHALTPDGPKQANIVRQTPDLAQNTPKTRWQPRPRRVQETSPSPSPQFPLRHVVRARNADNSLTSYDTSSISSRTPSLQDEAYFSLPRPSSSSVERSTDWDSTQGRVTTLTKSKGGYTKEMVFTNVPPCDNNDSEDVFQDSRPEYTFSADDSLTESQQLVFQSPPYKPFEEDQPQCHGDSQSCEPSEKQPTPAQTHINYLSHIHRIINADQLPVSSSTSQRQQQQQQPWSLDSTGRNDSGMWSDGEITPEPRDPKSRPMALSRSKDRGAEHCKDREILQGINECRTEPRVTCPSHIIHKIQPLPKSDKVAIGHPQATYTSENKSSQNIPNAAHNSGEDVLKSVPTRVSQPPDTLDEQFVQIPEFKSSWKRNSMRLATQGYTSMSDLTSSIECLQLNSKTVLEDTTPTNVPRVEDLHNQFAIRDSTVPFESFRDQQEEERSVDKHHVQVIHNGYSSVSQWDQNRNKTPTSEIDAEDEARDKVPGEGLNPPRQAPRSPIKRRSFRLATTSVADVWLLEEDYNELMATRGQTPGPELTKNADRDISETQIVSQNRQNICPRQNVRNTQKVSTPTLQVTHVGEDDEEQANRIKRRSFMLATSSISDLTCDVDEENILPQSPALNSKGGRYPDTVDSRVPSTPDSLRGRPRGSSISSGHLNSSFGSYYSCQSTNADRSSLSPKSAMRGTPPQWRESKDLNYSPPTPNWLGVSRKFENYDNVSGDSSFYTAANTSFLSSDQSAGSSPRFSDSRHSSSPRTQIRQWSRKSPYTRPGEIPHEHSRNDKNMDKNNSLPLKGKSSKHSRPLNTVFNCYGCGLEYGYPNLAQRRGRSGKSKSPSKEGKRKSRTSNEDHKRSYSTPPSSSSRSMPRSDSPPKAQPVQRQISAGSDFSSRSLSYTGGIYRSPDSASELSFVMDWQDMRRGPPSLGRPRRKMYAGFDSQPLPMGSFISDSSSAYSEAMSCSSRGGSRSVDLERSRGSEDFSDHSSPNKRAISSSATGVTTSQRRMSEDGIFDYFTYTDKRTSVSENNHNVYISRDSSYMNSGYKDNFSEKNFSNETLSSLHSDATATNGDHIDYLDLSNEDVKHSADEIFEECQKYNNRSSCSSDVFQSEKRTNELCEQDRLNKSEGSEIGSRWSTNSGFVTNFNGDGSKSQQGELTASGSACSNRAKFPSKLKYFSSKDILDLLMTPEKNAVGGATSLTSLEKQAQKVCKAILCCNEMEHPRVIGKEYHL